MIEPRSRGVLDPPPSRAMTVFVCSHTIPVIACDKRKAVAHGSEATTCPPKLNERRRKQSIAPHQERMDCFRLRQGFGGQVALLAMTWMDRARRMAARRAGARRGGGKLLTISSPQASRGMQDG